MTHCMCTVYTSYVQVGYTEPRCTCTYIWVGFTEQLVASGESWELVVGVHVVRTRTRMGLLLHRTGAEEADVRLSRHSEVGRMRGGLKAME